MRALFRLRRWRLWQELMRLEVCLYMRMRTIVRRSCLFLGGRFLLAGHGGLSLWDLGLNTEGARKMKTTMHASADGDESILGVVGLRVNVALDLCFFFLLAVVVRQ
jgi:hypothetical protein